MTQNNDEALILSEKRYRRLFEAAKDGIILLDFDTGMILDVNQFLIDLLGYTKDDFLKKYLWEVGFLSDTIASKANFLEMQQKHTVRFEDLPLETKDGEKVEVEFVANAYRENGSWVIQCNIRDITERKRAEREGVDKLKKMNKFMTGREIKMSELKKEINTLKEGAESSEAKSNATADHSSKVSAPISDGEYMARKE